MIGKYCIGDYIEIIFSPNRHSILLQNIWDCAVNFCMDLFSILSKSLSISHLNVLRQLIFCPADRLSVSRGNNY